MSICLDIFKASKVNTSLAQIQYCGFAFTYSRKPRNWENNPRKRTQDFILV